MESRAAGIASHPVACVLAFRASLPDVLASLAPVVIMCESTQRLHDRPADIEGASIVPVDRADRDVCWIECLLLNKAASDTQCLLGIICDRPSRLVPRSVANHLVESPVFGRNRGCRRELNWSTERIPMGQFEEDLASSI